jgi:hypothetical protein
MGKYRIKEVNYDNGETLFFAQISKLNGKSWINIGNPAGHYTIEKAKEDIEIYESFHNPPKIIGSKIHQI